MQLDREARERIEAFYEAEDELLEEAAEMYAEREAKRVAHRRTLGLVRSV